jgi:CheY-like chemotaxis protein
MSQANHTIIAAVDDMFFASKIRGAAEQAGRRLVFVRSRSELDENLASGAPAMIILDLNSERLEPIQTIQYLKSQPALAAIPILGFLSHVQSELKTQAEQAGCDRIMPRSAFSQRLPELMSSKTL